MRMHQKAGSFRFGLDQRFVVNLTFVAIPGISTAPVCDSPT